MAPERYDPSAQVALLKVLTDVLRLSHAADVMYDPEEAQVLRDGLARIDVAKPTASMAALADCIVLGHALKILDPAFDVSLIDRAGGPSRWLTTKRNLLFIYKGVFAYIRRSCRELMALAKVYDIRTTAKNPDDQGMSQLASIIVVAIFLGENNRDYIARLQTLEPAILGPIMHMIMAKQEECKRLAASTDVDDLIHQVLQTRDVDLAHEEEHESILTELETSRKQGSDLLSRLEHLQRNYDELVQEHNRQQDELAELRRSGSDSEFTSQRDKQRIREQEDVIASQEGEIQGYNETIRGLKVQIREYEKRVQKMDDLNDQVTELRHSNTELSKKANAAERYKQKLEAQQSLVTENSNLQFEKASLQKDYEDAVTKISTLDESLRKYKSRDESRTYAISEAGREVDELRIELLKKEQELATLKALRENDERVIYELQDQLKNGQGAPTQSSLASPSFQTLASSLEQELNGAEDEVPAPPVQQAPPPSATAALEISRLRADIALLKSNTVSSDEHDQALVRLDKYKAEAEREKKHFEGLMSQLADLQNKLSKAASLPAAMQSDIDATEQIKQAEADEESVGTANKEKFEKVRARLKQRTEQLEKAELENFELQRKLKVIQNEGGALGVQRDTIKAIQREAALVSTAWYDVTSRLQSSHVVLQRRSDVPKSWIGRQRQSVNGELVAFFRGLLRPPTPSPPSRPPSSSSPPRLLDAAPAPPATRSAMAAIPHLPAFSVTVLHRVFLPSMQTAASSSRMRTLGGDQQNTRRRMHPGAAAARTRVPLQRTS